MEPYESPESTMKFLREHILGRGAFACVFGGTLNGIPVAVKRIQLHDLEAEIQAREENILKSMDHENVLKILHIEENEDFKFLVLELCEATLHDYIRRRYVGDMPPDPNALHQMASGLNYIHSKGFVHRNVKPENVLISAKGVLKIADFGFCKPFRKTSSFSMVIPRGNRIYCAPEFLQLESKTNEEKEKINNDKAIDIFSLGCLFFCYIKMGDHPFAKPGSPVNYTVTSNIVHGKKYLHLAMTRDHYAFEIIDGMTQAVPEDRWKLEMVIELLTPRLVKDKMNA
ncbi:hypothetical protein GHT06_012029 [Daphnia sinensis]|uniref:Protein kinase domain-containing protein n=1 Tax=Daphnia sinensis TaxID=1820382 RepID=A0AAD5PWU0_9CRUS|nr:hypothetical protein GHT06_012029 [Daphnia sinensis]